MERRSRGFRRALGGALVLGLVMMCAGCSRSAARTQSEEGTPLSAHEEEVVRRAEALLGEVAAALCRQDRQRLVELAVTEQEYREIILPGSGRPGDRPVRMPPQKADFFTRLHRTKSGYALSVLLAACPLGALRFESAQLPAKLEERAGYKVFRDARLLFRDRNGDPVELRAGSVVAFGPEVKMLSYFTD